METLNQFFTYNNNPEMIRSTFLSLDNQMKLFHNRGFSVGVTASSIVNEHGLGFANFKKGLTEEQRQKNIEDLAKLAVGTYFSLPTGTFSDYTALPTSFFRENYNIMDSSILKDNENDQYYRQVLEEGNCTGYYNDYLQKLKMNNQQGKGNNNSRVLGYSTPQGRAMTNKDEAAYINVLFYPVIITVTAIVAYMIYVLFN